MVLLTVVFVKGLLERLSFRGLEWTYLVIPLSILAIAASTRLLQFEEETPATKKEADEMTPEPGPIPFRLKKRLDNSPITRTMGLLWLLSAGLIALDWVRLFHHWGSASLSLKAGLRV